MEQPSQRTRPVAKILHLKMPNPTTGYSLQELQISKPPLFVVKFPRFLLDLVLVFFAKLQPLMIALDVTTVGDKRFLQSSLKNCKVRHQFLFLPATALRLEL